MPTFYVTPWLARLDGLRKHSYDVAFDRPNVNLDFLERSGRGTAVEGAVTFDLSPAFRTLR